MTGRHIFVITLVLLLFGCAEVREVRLPQIIRVEQPPERDPLQVSPLQVFPETYRPRAIEFEKKGELRQALFAWQIVRSFSPDDAESSQKVQVLQKQIQTEADNHLRKGVEYLGRNMLQAARREFLMTLAYNSKHQEALNYLEQKAVEPDYMTYEVKQGDTVTGIAQKMYRDPGKDFIVAYFNDLGSGDQLKPGIVLRLPILEPEPKAEGKMEPRPPSKATPKAPSKARPAPSAGLYDKAGAENHYRKGLQYFLAENLQGAVKEWEVALRLDPEHPNAKRDMEKAQWLLKSVESK
jgi:tetratricopeptide (TPR) repeat protein